MDSVALSAGIRFQVDDQLSALDFLQVRIAQVEQRLRAMEVPGDSLALLQSIPGIQFVTAISLVGIVGDITRFRHARAFARFTGLTPGYRDSGATQRSIGITHEGSSLLRWLLIQAEQHYRRKCTYAAHLYHRIAYRSCVQKAKVAVAHRLARVIYHVWTEQRPFYATA
jgi:transposase